MGNRFTYCRWCVDLLARHGRAFRFSVIAFSLVLSIAVTYLRAADPEVEKPSSVSASGSVPETQPGKLWGKEVEHFQMSLSVSSLSCSATEPLIATITIKNNADQAQGFLWAGGFALTVRDEAGEIVPTTRHGKAVQEMNLVNPRPVSWKAGESKTYQVVVNRERDMTLEGNYSLSVSLGVIRDKADFPVLESNVIKVKVEALARATTKAATGEHVRHGSADQADP